MRTCTRMSQPLRGWPLKRSTHSLGGSLAREAAAACRAASSCRAGSGWEHRPLQPAIQASRLGSREWPARWQLIQLDKKAAGVALPQQTAAERLEGGRPAQAPPGPANVSTRLPAAAAPFEQARHRSN